MLSYTSPSFSTQSKMEEEKRILHDKIAEYVGVPREEFKLQRGLITLDVLMNNQWIPYTSVIGNFKQVMRDHKESQFRLRTKVQFKES